MYELRRYRLHTDCRDSRNDSIVYLYYTYVTIFIDIKNVIVLYKTIMKIDETNFLYIITNIRQRLFKSLESELSKENIKDIAPSFGDILFVLDQKGTITMQEVAKHTIKDKSTISSVINKLEAGGYITKEKDSGDARYTNLTLTPKAKKLRPVLFDISNKMNTKLFEGLSDMEKQTLFELIGKVYKNL
jgi:DNA-binding MarR family transcriptional regulator